jgi:hypothetical protein
MNCNVSQGAVWRLKKAENAKNACIRLVKDYNVAKQAKRILQCGNREHCGVEVYRSRSNGIGIKYNGVIVFHALYESVTICKFDLAWVDVLPTMVTEVENEMRQARTETNTAYNEAVFIESNFKVG